MTLNSVFNQLLFMREKEGVEPKVGASKYLTSKYLKLKINDFFFY